MPQPPGGPGRRPAFDVFPAANRAHELCALVARPGDARVADQLPPPPVRRGDLPSVVGTARVPEGRSFAEGFRDHLRGPLAGDVVHLDLDAEGLGFHGGLLSPGGGFSRPARPCFLGGFPPGAYIHHSAGPKSQRFFTAQAGTPTRRPEPPPGTLSDFALRKSGGRHTSPLCSGEVGRQVGVPSRRAEVCPGGGGRIPGCAWRRPRPPHA